MLILIIRKNLGAVKMWSIIIVYILNYLYNRCSGGGSGCVLTGGGSGGVLSGGYRLGGATFLLFILLNIAYQKNDDGTIATTAHSLSTLSSSSPSSRPLSTAQSSIDIY